MERSEELRGCLSSLIETFGTPLMGSAFSDAIAAEPGVLLVGTDPAEWWGDPDNLLRVVQAQGKELQGAAAAVTHSEGWVQGEVGWGAVRAVVSFPDGVSRHAADYRDAGSPLRWLEDRPVPHLNRHGQRGGRRQGAHGLTRPSGPRPAEAVIEG
jgi:hypothetical protein